MSYGPLCYWECLFFLILEFDSLYLFFFVKLQEFCGAFALTEEKCRRSLMETAQVICAGRVEDLYLANTESTITNTFFFNLYTLICLIYYFLSFPLSTIYEQLVLFFEVYVLVACSFLQPNCKRMESLSCPSWLVYVSMTEFGTARFWEAFCPVRSYRLTKVGLLYVFQTLFICFFYFI